MGFWRSFNFQLFVSHVLVSVLTVMLLFAGIGYLLGQNITLEEYRYRAMLDVMEWQFDQPGFVETYGGFYDKTYLKVKLS